MPAEVGWKPNTELYVYICVSITRMFRFVKKMLPTPVAIAAATHRPPPHPQHGGRR